MRLLTCTFLVFTITIHVSAQSRQQRKVDSAFQQVVKYFNQKNADAIYNMAGAGFQNEISIDAFSKVANNQLFQLGRIKETSLISFVNNSVATYKLSLDSATLQLLVSLDERDRLSLFLFQTYQPPAADKTALVATSNPMRTNADKEIDAIARKYIQKANTVGVIIGIIKNGNTSIYSYGETTKRNGKLPNENTFFEIGSITETFTTTLLAWYVNQGTVRLTDPITQYLPDSVAANPALKGVTLLNLSNHTSGLARLPDNLEHNASDPLNPYKDYTKQLLYSYLKTCKPESKPGQKYVYSNLAIGLLGSILEEVNHQPFEQMVHDVICKPLNMFSTTQYLSPMLVPRFAQVYNTAGAPTEPWNFDVLAPCGALRSTMNDMLIFAKANMYPTATELSKALQLTHKITFNNDVKIGLGWHVIVADNVEYYFHNGGTNGSSSFFAFNADKNIAVVVLSNAVESTDNLGAAILRRVR